MNVSSLSVFLWLFATIVVAWIPPKRLQPYLIVLTGLSFLAWAAPISLGILFASSLLTFGACANRKPHGKIVSLIVTVAAVVFIYFKRSQLGETSNIVIPLGLSYYLFRQIHYVFECYKGSLRKHGFVEYLAYLALLPTIVVGPIHRFPEFLSDLRRRRWDWARFSLGLERVFHGYAKLIIVANYIVAKPLKDLLDPSGAETAGILGALSRSLFMWVDLYVRFSAYTDIAIGASAMVGFVVMENFKRPFAAVNLGDFWSRWHISLTSWCRDYVYKPIAAVTRRPVFAASCAMLVIGLWHEFSLRYLLWGVYHASGLAVERRWQFLRRKWPPFEKSLPKAVERVAATVLTLTFVISSFPVTTWLNVIIMKLVNGG